MTCSILGTSRVKKDDDKEAEAAADKVSRYVVTPRNENDDRTARSLRYTSNIEDDKIPLIESWVAWMYYFSETAFKYINIFSFQCTR